MHIRDLIPQYLSPERGQSIDVTLHAPSEPSSPLILYTHFDGLYLPPLYGSCNTQFSRSYFASSATFIVRYASKSNFGSSGSDITVSELLARSQKACLTETSCPVSLIVPAYISSSSAFAHPSVQLNTQRKRSTHHCHLLSSCLPALSFLSTQLSPCPSGSPSVCNRRLFDALFAVRRERTGGRGHMKFRRPRHSNEGPRMLS